MTKYEPYLAFSIYTNGAELFSIQKSESSDMIGCLHGIRAISATWIVLGHTFIFYLLLPTRDMATIFEVNISVDVYTCRLCRVPSVKNVLT